MYFDAGATEADWVVIGGSTALVQEKGKWVHGPYRMGYPG